MSKSVQKFLLWLFWYYGGTHDDGNDFWGTSCCGLMDDLKKKL